MKGYEEGGCAPAFSQDVELTGAWLGDRTIFVRAGSLESSAPFAVSVHGSTFKELLLAAGLFVRGEVTHDELEWGPDAKVVIEMDHAEVGLKQHTEGRGEESRAMTSVSAGLAPSRGPLEVGLVLTVLRDAGHRPANNCPAVLLSTTAERESRNRGKVLAGFRSSRKE